MASTVKVNFVGDNSDLKRAVDSTDKELSGLTGKVSKHGAAIAAGFAAGAVGAAVVAKATIDAASDQNEALSKSNTVFGDAAKEIDDWSKQTAKSMGLSRTEALSAAGGFGNLFDQLGLAPDLSADMSKGLVELAGDFASFHNADITEVLEAQSAAFRGEYDSLQKFVPTINAAAVEQKALALTGKALTSELTQQDKALAVNALMFEGAGDAQGDFARTSDGAANQQRILQARMADLQAEIGQKLLPIFVALMGFILDDLIPALEKTAAWIDEHIVPALQAFGRFVRDDVVPALQAFAGFINDHVIPVIQRVIGWYIDWIGFLIKVGAAIIDLGTKVYNFAVDVVTIFSNLITYIRELPTKIKNAAAGMWDGITDAFKAAINSIIRMWNSFELGFSWGGKDMPGPIPDIPGFDIKIPTPNMPYLAAGGVVSGPMSGFPAMLHGTEAVIPLNSPRASGMFGGGPQTIILQLNGREVARALTEDQRGGGEPVYVKLAAR